LDVNNACFLAALNHDEEAAAMCATQTDAFHMSPDAFSRSGEGVQKAEEDAEENLCEATKASGYTSLVPMACALEEGLKANKAIKQKAPLARSVVLFIFQQLEILVDLATYKQERWDKADVSGTMEKVSSRLASFVNYLRGLSRNSVEGDVFDEQLRACGGREYCYLRIFLRANLVHRYQTEYFAKNGSLESYFNAFGEDSEDAEDMALCPQGVALMPYVLLTNWKLTSNAKPEHLEDLRQFALATLDYGNTHDSEGSYFFDFLELGNWGVGSMDLLANLQQSGLKGREFKG
jgi:hypothetical protein